MTSSNHQICKRAPRKEKEKTPGTVPEKHCWLRGGLCNNHYASAIHMLLLAVEKPVQVQSVCAYYANSGSAVNKSRVLQFTFHETANGNGEMKRMCQVGDEDGVVAVGN